LKKSAGIPELNSLTSFLVPKIAIHMTNRPTKIKTIENKTKPISPRPFLQCVLPSQRIIIQHNESIRTGRVTMKYIDTDTDTDTRNNKDVPNEIMKKTNQVTLTILPNGLSLAFILSNCGNGESPHINSHMRFSKVFLSL
jgi:hypothetical protein